MRIFKTRAFSRWATKEGLTDDTLRSAVDEMARGLIDAELGGQVCKKRVAVGGQGKSGGVRTLVAFRLEDKAFFMHGFAKNARANISDKELYALKLMARELLRYGCDALDQALCAGALVEITETWELRV